MVHTFVQGAIPLALLFDIYCSLYYLLKFTLYDLKWCSKKFTDLLAPCPASSFPSCMETYGADTAQGFQLGDV